MRVSHATTAVFDDPNLVSCAGLAPVLTLAQRCVLHALVAQRVRLGRGYTGTKGLNALIATVSTPVAAPVIAATRLRRGSANSARGAPRLVADALATARRAGATGLLIVRADSAFYGYEVAAAARRAGARFSVTARMDPAVSASIDETAWTPIRYPNAVWDEDEARWVSDAEVAEMPFTAFTSRRKAEHVTARLIARRVKRLNPTSASGEVPNELFAGYRYHGVFTDSPLTMLEAEVCHRRHAIIGAGDRRPEGRPAGPHLPSGLFTANDAWLVCAAMAFNLTRAAGVLASTFHAKATTATIRAQLIAVPGRLVRTARRLVLHLPRDWPWQAAWAQLHTTVTATGPTRPGLTPDHRPAGPDRSYRQWRSRTDRRTRHTPTTEQDHSAGRPDVLRHHIGSGGRI